MDPVGSLALEAPIIQWQVSTFTGSPLPSGAQLIYTNARAARPYGVGIGDEVLLGAVTIPPDDTGPEDPLVGDLNGDEVVNVADVTLLAAYLNGSASLPDLEAADIDEDGEITESDLQELISNVLGASPILPGPPVPLLTIVNPSEPATIPHETTSYSFAGAAEPLAGGSSDEHVHPFGADQLRQLRGRVGGQVLQ